MGGIGEGTERKSTSVQSEVSGRCIYFEVCTQTRLRNVNKGSCRESWRGRQRHFRHGLMTKRRRLIWRRFPYTHANARAVLFHHPLSLLSLSTIHGSTLSLTNAKIYTHVYCLRLYLYVCVRDEGKGGRQTWRSDRECEKGEAGRRLWRQVLKHRQ